MTGIIDRFEEDLAVIELSSGKMVNIQRDKIPSEAKEGDVLNIEDNITINKKETEKRKTKMKRKTEGMWID